METFQGGHDAQSRPSLKEQGAAVAPLAGGSAPARRQEDAAVEDDGADANFVRIGDEIKIGYTTDIVQRLGQLSPDEVLALVLGDFEYEQAVHRTLAPYRSHGREWYHADAEPILEIIDVVRSYSNLPSLRAA